MLKLPFVAMLEAALLREAGSTRVFVSNSGKPPSMVEV